jgi:hypothetical protein
MAMIIEPKYKWFRVDLSDGFELHIGNVGRDDLPYSISWFSLFVDLSAPNYRWYWTGVDHYDARPYLAFGCGLFRVSLHWWD